MNDYTEEERRIIDSAVIYEAAFLGACLTFPESFETCLQAISAEDFHVKEFSTVFSQMCEAYDFDTSDFNLPALEAAAKASGVFDTLNDIVNRPATAATDAVDLARTMCRYNYRVRVLQAISVAPGRDCVEEIDELRSELEHRLDLLGGTEMFGLPKPTTLTQELVSNPPPLAPPVVDGVLRKGHKMIISGASKTGKSYLAMELALAIANGTEWIGFGCNEGRVLYFNLEIDHASCMNRFSNICKTIGLAPNANLDVVNMRGRCRPLDRLEPHIIKMARRKSYSCIILDPIYKIITGDENSASEMAEFVGIFDKICAETGAAIVYVHHHSKGSQGQKNAQDRFSGSGVFARDPDAIIDLVRLQVPEGVNIAGIPLQVDGSLREFKQFEKFSVIFDHPVHRLGDYITDGFTPEGQVSKDVPRPKKDGCAEQIWPEFEIAFFNRAVDGKVKISELQMALGKDRHTIRDYVNKKCVGYYYCDGAGSVVKERTQPPPQTPPGDAE